MNEIDDFKQAQKIHNDLVESEFYFSVMYISRDNFLSLKKTHKPALDGLDFVEFSSLLLGASIFFEGLWNMNKKNKLTCFDHCKKYLVSPREPMNPLEKDIVFVQFCFMMVFKYYSLCDLVQFPSDSFKEVKIDGITDVGKMVRFGKKLKDDIKLRGEKAILKRIHEINEKITREEKEKILVILSHVKGYQIVQNIGFK